MPYFLRNLSTRPAVSSIFCLPVQKGWHSEHTSIWSSPEYVDFVLNLLPQLHCTVMSSYFGCISAFINLPNLFCIKHYGARILCQCEFFRNLDIVKAEYTKFRYQILQLLACGQTAFQAYEGFYRYSKHDRILTCYWRPIYGRSLHRDFAEMTRPCSPTTRNYLFPD